MKPPVVIYRLGSLGDTLVALPCFHKIAEAFPQQRKLVLTNVPVSSKAAPLAVILQPGGFIDGVIEYPLQLRSVRSLWHLRRQLRNTGASTLIYLAANRGRLAVWRDVLFFKLCGFKKIIGAPLTADLLENRKNPVDGTEEPEAERLARTLHSLGAIELNRADAWDLRLTSREAEAADRAIATLAGQPFFAVNMGGKVAPKDWGEANWHALIDQLAVEYPELHLVVVGAAEDAPRADALLSRWPAGRVSVCGTLSPRECAAVLAQARFFIGHDSGPLHLAATMQTACVGLFGNYNHPKKWHPYGQKHRILHDMRGVQAITVEEVVSAVRQVAPHG
ncbi:glycosyltransferase family 9 protein [Solimonas flava]|uniref:glycosyltransferase family 9 protein n=1 Tax=Solimonas flava TaxID=415849 RepID=UPI0004882A9D|nr:glycosyltransferase family 9 protein [Solimonas flava]